MGFSFKNLDPRRIGKGKGNPFNAIQNEIKSIKNKVDDIPHKIEQEVEYAVKSALKEVGKGLKQLSDPVIRKLLKEVLEHFVKVSYLAPKSVHFGMRAYIGISFDFDLQASLHYVRAWAKRPPRNNFEMRKFIIDLAPTTVTVSASLEVPVLSGIGIDGGVSWDKDFLVDNWDKIT